MKKVLLRMVEEFSADRVIRIPSYLSKEEEEAYIDKAMDIFCEAVDKAIKNLGDGKEFVVEGHDYSDCPRWALNTDDNEVFERVDKYGEKDLVWKTVLPYDEIRKGNKE